MPGVRAFFTYARLAALWCVRPGTIKDWITDLRQHEPEKVYLTYRLVRGHQRTAFIAQETAEALEARHFPRNQPALKRRGSSRNRRPPSYIRRRMAAEAAERAALAPERVAPAATGIPASASAGVGRTPAGIRRLTLPPMPRRDDPRRQRSS